MSESNPLPFVLSNGLPDGGDSKSIQLFRNDDEVEISVRYMNSTIILRHSSIALSFSFSVPELFNLDKRYHQLCGSSCDTLVIRTEKKKIPEAKSVCESITTDSFFDSCMFDMLKFGDFNSSLLSMYAQRDAVRLRVEKGFVPSTNRTELRDLHVIDSAVSLHQELTLFTVFYALIAIEYTFG